MPQIDPRGRHFAARARRPRIGRYSNNRADVILPQPIAVFSVAVFWARRTTSIEGDRHFVDSTGKASRGLSAAWMVEISGIEPVVDDGPAVPLGWDDQRGRLRHTRAG